MVYLWGVFNSRPKHASYSENTPNYVYENVEGSPFGAEEGSASGSTGTRRWLDAACVMVDFKADVWARNMYGDLAFDLAKAPRASHRARGSSSVETRRKCPETHPIHGNNR